MKDRLYLRYSRNDLKRNWGVNTALMAILVLSAFLMATGCMVMERLLGGINQLFEEAKPPHFLQMHTGGLRHQGSRRLRSRTSRDRVVVHRGHGGLRLPLPDMVPVLDR